MEQQIMEKESELTMKKLEDEALLFHEKTTTDAQFYKIQKAAESNQVLLTPEFLRLEMIKSIANTTKVYFGPALQSMLLEFMDLLTNKQLSGESLIPKK